MVCSVDNVRDCSIVNSCSTAGYIYRLCRMVAAGWWGSLTSSDHWPRSANISSSCLSLAAAVAKACGRQLLQPCISVLGNALSALQTSGRIIAPSHRYLTHRVPTQFSWLMLMHAAAWYTKKWK